MDRCDGTLQGWPLLADPYRTAAEVRDSRTMEERTANTLEAALRERYSQGTRPCIGARDWPHLVDVQPISGGYRLLFCPSSCDVCEHYWTVTGGDKRVCSACKDVTENIWACEFLIAPFADASQIFGGLIHVFENVGIRIQRGLSGGKAPQGRV